MDEGRTGRWSIRFSQFLRAQVFAAQDFTRKVLQPLDYLAISRQIDDFNTPRGRGVYPFVSSVARALMPANRLQRNAGLLISLENATAGHAIKAGKINAAF